MMNQPQVTQSAFNELRQTNTNLTAQLTKLQNDKYLALCHQASIKLKEKPFKSLEEQNQVNLQQTLDTQKNQIENLLNQLAYAQNEKKQVSDQKKQLEAQLQQQSSQQCNPKQLQDLEAKNLSITNELQQIQTKDKQQQQQISELQQKNQELTQKYETQIQQLNQKNQQLQEELKNIQDKPQQQQPTQIQSTDNNQLELIKLKMDFFEKKAKIINVFINQQNTDLIQQFNIFTSVFINNPTKNISQIKLTVQQASALTKSSLDNFKNIYMKLVNKTLPDQAAKQNFDQILSNNLKVVKKIINPSLFELKQNAYIQKIFWIVANDYFKLLMQQQSDSSVIEVSFDNFKTFLEKYIVDDQSIQLVNKFFKEQIRRLIFSVKKQITEIIIQNLEKHDATSDHEKISTTKIFLDDEKITKANLMECLSIYQFFTEVDGLAFVN